MKLSGAQADAIYNVIKDQLVKSLKTTSKENKKKNLAIKADTLSKFKLTDEYKALVLLAKSFKSVSSVFEKQNKETLQKMADTIIKPTYLEEHHYPVFHEVKQNILLLSLSCANSKELSKAINVHYNLTNKIAL